MNLMRKPPLGLKEPKAKPDPVQIGPTFSHHTFCGRFSQEKTPDREAIPLCHLRHQGAFGIHTDKSAWVQEFGSDRDYIAATLDKLGV